MNAKIHVRYVHEVKGKHTGNILWLGRWPMNGGKFPPNHPIGGMLKDFRNGEYGSSPQIKAFRERGYWASCFPEGYGITLHSANWDKTDEQVRKDIAECFGWTIDPPAEARGEEVE